MNFVIGHPRSGTMFLSHLLNTCRQGVSAHELLFGLSWDSVWLPSEYYAGRADDTMVARLLAHYQRRPAGLEIDSNWKLTWILPVALAMFPSARVLHLWREPRETIRSCLELDYYGDLWARPAADEPVRRRNYWLHWMPRIRRDDWHELSQLGRNCAFWTETHRLALAAQALGPRYLRVGVEELERDEAVLRVADFFELPAPAPERLNALRAAGRANVKAHEKSEVRALKGTAAQDTWDQATFERLCGPMARSLGYAV